MNLQEMFNFSSGILGIFQNHSQYISINYIFLHILIK